MKKILWETDLSFQQQQVGLGGGPKEGGEEIQVGQEAKMIYIFYILIPMPCKYNLCLEEISRQCEIYKKLRRIWSPKRKKYVHVHCYFPTH